MNKCLMDKKMFSINSGTVPDGSVNNPLLIYTADDLNAIRQGVFGYSINFNLGANYRLMQDIDFLDPTNKSKYYDNLGWDGLGTSALGFSGSFNGGMHVIKNLRINRPTSGNQGLFGADYGSSVKNLGLINVDITADANVGAFYGCIQGSGSNNIRLQNCYAMGVVKGTTSVGGLIGNFGLIASTQEIKNCYSTVDVSGNISVGGLVGPATGKLTSSFALNSKVMRLTGTNLNFGKIAGIVSGSGTVNNCKSLPTIKYYDSEGSSGTTDFSGLNGNNGSNVSLEDAKLQATYTNLGWAFGNSDSAPWRIIESQSYPLLYFAPNPT
jgi:hypothetical protein